MVDIIRASEHFVKNFFRIGRQDNANEFRGAAHDLDVSRIILGKSTKIFVNYRTATPHRLCLRKLCRITPKSTWHRRNTTV